MDRLQFKCGQCGKMMAVGKDLMGKQVSCPHCKKIVVAPMQAPAPAPAAATTPMPMDMPMFKVPDQGEAESIFGAPEEDDPFEAGGRAPTVEMPAVHAPVPPPAPELAPTQNYPGSDAFTNEPAGAMANFGSAPDMAGTAVADAPMNTGTANARALTQKRSQQDSLVTYYAMMILIPYAILMTIFTVYFYQRSQNLIPIFQVMPDWPREQQQPFKGGASKRVEDEKPLPQELMVALGSTIQLNDLQVTPLKVEQKKIKYLRRLGDAGEESHNNAMVLTLRVKNTSSEYQFAPNDLAYNRYTNLKKSTQNPYTCLEVGETRFYGGPCRWPKKPDKGEGWRGEDPIEWIDGTHAAPGQNSTMLKPGEEIDLIVCTNPDIEATLVKGPMGKLYHAPTEVVETVNQSNGPFVWRVQLRTGVLALDEKRTGTVTSVFGVKFKKDDIKQPG
ncbi:MAG: hypothetical protein AB7K24_11520 [Gemmataceae bacterium]